MSDAFQVIVRDLDYPMLVVTAAEGDNRSGCLVGFSSQCSLDPELYMVMISKTNHTHAVATTAPHLALHFLAADEMGLAELFGQATGDEVDKFALCGWEPGPHGVVVLSGCRRWVCGEVQKRLDAGDHTALLVAPVGGKAEPAWPDQLGFQRVKGLEPGHPA